MDNPVKGIYLIERIETSSNDKRKYYVGQSIDIFKRFNEHCSNPNPGIDEAISKLGPDKFCFKVLEIVKYAENLGARESKWIDDYKKMYGDEQMYNISQTTNKTKKIDPQIKKSIENLFIEDIGRSIYAIAESFGIWYMDVIKIRKPLLKERGLKWDKIKRNIIDIKTGEIPENWRGHLFTEKIVNKIKSMNAQGYSEKDIDFVSNSDLKIFISSVDDYTCAEPII